jgi:hypothetical protein
VGKSRSANSAFCAGLHVADPVKGLRIGSFENLLLDSLELFVQPAG